MKIPVSPEGLTVEWVTDVLRKRGAIRRGRIRSLDAKVLGGSRGTLGQLVRLSLGYDTDEASGPRSLIAKIASADTETKTILNQTGTYEREVRFYQELAGQIELRTPRCYYSDINTETGDFVLLLEDLVPARNGNRAAGCSLVEAELAIREAAKLHAAWWENPQLAEKIWVRSFNSAPGLQIWQGVYQQRWDPFVAQMEPHLPKEILEIGQWLGGNMAQTLNQFHEPPRTLVHNDYMLDNFFFATTGDSISLTVVDWQLLTYGRGALDVASFLGGNMSPEDRRTYEMDLLRTYHTLLVENGVSGYPFTQCMNDYRFSMLDGLVRMVNAIGGGGMRDEQERTHRDIIWPRFCAAILDLNVIELLPR